MMSHQHHQRNKSESQLDYSHNTWISLLGLLRPIEFFVTVDHFPIWRRHLAWSKISGSDLRTHIMQRFSSSMVFMSLLLGAELGVLFNSSEITSDMRKSMANEEYADYKFWVGVTIILSVCVTITALVATFTAWGMISSVSDANMRCVIRSSIGQYVTQLPTHLVVTALYLFLLWVVLFLVDILSGVGRFIILLLVGTLFFQVVVAYSAFGRLIVHTGAMGKKGVLSPELEQALLPSGLHASLLLRATTRKKKRTSVVSQYRPAQVKSSLRSTSTTRSMRGNSTRSMRSRRLLSRENSQLSLSSNASSKSRRKQRKRVEEEKKSDRGDNNNGGQDSFVLGDFEEHLIRQTARAFSSSVVYTNDKDTSDSPLNSDEQQQQRSTKSHQRSSSDSSSSIELTQVFSRPPRPLPAVPSHKATEDDDNDIFGIVSDDDEEEEERSRNKQRPYSKRRQARLSRELQARRQSMCLMKSMGSFRVREEWDNENAAREIYDMPPPPDLPSESEEEDCSDEWDSEWESMPRASVLNRHIGWQSLRRLVNESPATVDESLSPDEENGVNVGAGPAGETDRLLKRQGSEYLSVSGKK